jgi:predicted phage tail protein
VSVVVAPRTQPSGVGRVAVQALNRAALLTWPAPASDGGAMVRNYRIQRSTDGVTWHAVTSTAPISRAFTVTGLTNGVRYRFRVAAANIAGPGAWSAAAVVTPRPVASAPGRPTGTAGSRKVTLRWSAPASPGGSAITGYRLLKSVNGITWLVVTATAPTTRTFTVSGLTNGVAYRFRVAAVNGVGLGAWSSVGIATPHA